jgi:hypothetical protein
MSNNITKQWRSRLAQEESKKSKKSEEQPQDPADEQQPQPEAEQERVKEAQRMDQTMALVSHKILLPGEDLLKGRLTAVDLLLD